MDSVDDLDLRLIRCLQDNPRAPYAAIGRLTGVSETTAKRRVDDLIARGIIQPAIIANIASVGYPLRAYVYLKVQAIYLREVAQTLCDYPETSSVAIVTGRYNIACLVALHEVQDLTTFMIDRIASLPGILDAETVVCSEMLKMFSDWRLPVEWEVDVVEK